MLARLMLHETNEDEKRASSTDTHADKLAGLVNDVLRANRRGECESLDPERL